MHRGQSWHRFQSPNSPTDGWTGGGTSHFPAPVPHGGSFRGGSPNTSWWTSRAVRPSDAGRKASNLTVNINDSFASSDTHGLVPEGVSLSVTDVVEEETPADTGVALELSLSLEEQLTVAFRAREVDGCVVADRLPAVLALLPLPCGPEAVQAAIRSVLPDDKDGKAAVSLADALLVLQRCLAAKEADPDDASKATSETSSADSRQDQSLCWLLTAVVGVIFLCAATVAGLAILWLWLITMGQSGKFLQADLHLNEDMLRVMLHDEFISQRAEVALDNALIIGTLVEEMGYGLADRMSQDGLSTAAGLLRRTLDAWWQRDAMVGLANTARMMSTVVGRLARDLPLPKLANLTARLNSEVLPYGHELLLAQRTPGPSAAVQYLSPLRYAAECNASLCDLSPAANQPMALALANRSGAMRGAGYRGQAVVAGYANASAAGLGVVYQVDLEAQLSSFAERVGAIMDALNAEATDERELLVARVLPDGTLRYVTQLYQCSGACLAAAEAALATGTSAMPRALRGETGILENVDYRGIPVIAGFTFIPSVRMGVVVKVSRETLKATILRKLAAVLNGVNAKFPKSDELELQITAVENGTQRIVPLTTYREAAQCSNRSCAVPSYIQAAARDCSTGVATGPDYRGAAVTAGYTCLPDLDAYVAYTTDQGEIEENEVALATESGDQMNSNDRTSFELVLGRPLPGVSRFTVSQGIGKDFTVLTKDKFAEEQGCASSGCAGSETCMQYALRGQQGVVSCLDSRDVPSLAATTYLDAFDLGLSAEVDMSEVMSPVFSTAFILLGVSCGALVGTAVLLSWYTRVMVKSMVTAECEGQETIRQEKQRFSALVQAMYPTYVLDRVLAGEHHIVQMLPHTAVFFSDIYNFTVASSRLTATELLQLMGYTYGVMDQVAGYFKITKVKTVGDAYLAISGLPGVETENCCLDMLRFASTVAQVFSCKFDHPSQGAVLDFFLPARGRSKSKDNSTLPRESVAFSAMPRESVAFSVRSPRSHATPSQAPVSPRGSQQPKHHLSTSSSNPVITVSESVHSSAPRSSQSHDLSPKVRCVMYYGIAAGPVTAGVLQGKNPMFDIWGKTVNLASRMQSTGIPGRIQVSELFYKSILAIPGQQYSFEESHQTMCKGFGMVRCYFVQSTTDAPPPELVDQLGLEPNLGLFFYDSPVGGPRGGDPPASNSPNHSPSNSPKPNNSSNHGHSHGRSHSHSHGRRPSHAPSPNPQQGDSTASLLTSPTHHHPHPGPRSPRAAAGGPTKPRANARRESAKQTQPKVVHREDPLALLEADDV